MSFRLEPLLRHRRFLEEGCQRQLAEAHRRWAEAEERLQDLLREREAARRNRSPRLAAGDIRAVLDVDRYLEGQEERIQEQARQVARLVQAREAKRADLLEAVKQRKMVEKLKDRHRAEELLRQARLEQKLSDDLGVYRRGGPAAGAHGQELPDGAAKSALAPSARPPQAEGKGLGLGDSARSPGSAKTWHETCFDAGPRILPPTETDSA